MTIVGLNNDYWTLSFIWGEKISVKRTLNDDYQQRRLEWSEVTVTAVTVTVGYSDSFGNPRFITNKNPLLTVTKNRLQ